MIDLYAVVEGSSEERFLSSVVAPHLASYSVWLYPMRVLRGGGQRGGGSSWQPWRKHLTHLFKSHSRPQVRFTTMLDLYAVPKDIPGWSESGGASYIERADRILREVEKDLQEPRFLPYIQVHEFETFLFVDLQALAQRQPDILLPKPFGALQREVESLPPEAINDGRETAPSRRLLACSRGFNKLVHVCPSCRPSDCLACGGHVPASTPGFGPWKPLRRTEAMPRGSGRSVASSAAKLAVVRIFRIYLSLRLGSPSPCVAFHRFVPR